MPFSLTLFVVIKTFMFWHMSYVLIEHIMDMIVMHVISYEVL